MTGWSTLINLLRGLIAVLPGIGFGITRYAHEPAPKLRFRFIVFSVDMSSSLRAVRLAPKPLATVFQGAIEVTAAVATLLLFPALAFAEGDSVLQPLNLNGSLRAGYYGASRSLDGRRDVGTGALWLKAAPSLGGDASLQFEGWVRNDDSFKGRSQRKLREGYINLTTGDADWRIGKQIIVWGRADGINPTDNLTPRDYTLLTPETDDQRLGALAAKMSYHFAEATLTAIWLPRFAASVYPIPPQPGVSFSEEIPRANQGAFKLDHAGGAADWSLSYFNGFDQLPDLQIASPTNLVLQHRRIRVLGMDGATTAGRYGLRAEAVYTWTDNAENDPLVKQPFLYAVLGGDRTFGDNFNINLQYYFRRVTGYQDPQSIPSPQLRALAIQQAVLSNQLTLFQHGLTLRVSDKWFNETLEGEIAAVASMTNGDFMLRPKLVYAFSDTLKGTLGGDLFRGGANTFYGRLRNNSSAFVELKYSF